MKPTTMRLAHQLVRPLRTVFLEANLVGVGPFVHAKGKASYTNDGILPRFMAELINTGLPAFTLVDAYVGATRVGSGLILLAHNLYPNGTFITLDAQLGSVVPTMLADDVVQFRLQNGIVVVSGAFHK